MDTPTGSTFDACLNEALVRAHRWVPRWLGQLNDALQTREAAAFNAHEKHAFVQARLALSNYRDRLSERFLVALSEAVLGHGALPSPRAPSAQAPGAGPRKLASLSFDDLELMDHHQVQETVELARVQQVVKMAAEEDLVGLTALLSRAQGHSVVRVEANPLAPDVVVAALLRALGELYIDEGARARWLQAGAVPLGGELQRWYRELTQLLGGWGVLPAGYVVVQTGAARAPAGPGPRTESVPAADVSGGEALLTLDHLHQLLVGNLEQSGTAVSDQGASGSGNAMVRTLATEVVTQMLRRIAEDPRLLAPVREMVQGLKPALLQLARSDPRFFADRENPARRLLDTITERSLAFASEQDRGYEGFARQVRAAVQALQSPSPDLSGRIAEQLRLLAQQAAPVAAPGRGLAVQTLVRVEQRHLLAERVAAEIQARNDFARAPGTVRRFLAGPWSQVVAQARLEAHGGEADQPADAPAQRYMGVLPDLLWSCQLAQASQNRSRLIKVIPGLLRTLREGLDAIDYPRAQAEAFFHALMGLHEAAYKTQRSEQAMAAAEAQASRQAELEHLPWMQPGEARDSGFMDEMAMPPVAEFQDTLPQERESDPVREAALDVGCWVDLRQDDTPLRCQLSWASPHRTMFLFTGPAGQSISLTLRGLERLQSLGRLKVISDHSVVEEALDGVARQALYNSGKI
jgi:hypothetical protein